jgi:hypothetical protein
MASSNTEQRAKRGRWVPAAKLPSYAIDGSTRIRISDFLSRNHSPRIT